MPPSPEGGTWFVPGKLVLLGEYAVLDGAPALVAAVDVGVTCVVRPAASRSHEVPGDDRFAAAALRAADAPAGHYVFGAWNPPDLPAKPGLGGSAAATVAAFLAAGRTPWPAAAEVHRAVQGSGSGLDVAASAFGGVLRFQDGVVQPVARVDAVVIWSGRSAATGPRVAAYLTAPDRRPFVAASQGLVDAFHIDPIRVLREARTLLAAMTARAGIDWDTPEHARIAGLAERFGGAAKPSGAGGGDVAVALFPDDDARLRFTDACRADGLVPLQARITGPPHCAADASPARYDGA